MDIPNPEEKLGFKFKRKPLLVGGCAMEYYGLRKTGVDVDLILDREDHKRLKDLMNTKGMEYLKGDSKPGYKETPQFVDLYGDQGILVYEFELWTCIMRYEYDFLARDAVEKDNYLIISLENLLLLKALAMDKTKYLNDLKLIVKKIIKEKYR